MRARPRGHVREARNVLPVVQGMDLQRVRQGLAGTSQSSTFNTRQEGQQGMNAQRSVWSLPPTTVAQKYATYFGGLIDNPRYIDKPFIRLWWTDAAMKRLVYRELVPPNALVDLLRFAYYRLYDNPDAFVPALTEDNLIVFHSIVNTTDGRGIYTANSVYVVCDPERVLRYGLVPLPLSGSEPYSEPVTFDTGSWTWDGKSIWPIIRVEENVFTCEIDTTRNTFAHLQQVFAGYISPSESGRTAYVCASAKWITSAQGTNAIFATTSRLSETFVFPEDGYPYSTCAYELTAQYLPDGPAPISISVGDPGCYTRLIVEATFPIGSVALVSYRFGGSEGTLYIVHDDRVAIAIPIKRVPDSSLPIPYYYYETTSTGLPYDLVVLGQLRLLRSTNGTVTILFEDTKRLAEFPSGPYVQALVEYDLASGRAVKDRVVPSIMPRWGMEHEGDILAVPYVTSSKGRLRLP
jgi:hypothetical protein